MEGWKDMGVSDLSRTEGTFPRLRESEAGTFVGFSSEPNEFFVLLSVCDNPECSCSEATFLFVEIDGSGAPIERGKAFSTQADLATWRIPDSDGAPADVAALVEELRRESENPVRAWASEYWQRAKRQQKRILEYRIDPDEVRRGSLLSFSDVADEKGGLLSGGRGCSFVLTHEGEEYAVEELYCPDPGCRCRNVHLCFHGPNEVDGKKVVTLCFRGSMTLRGRMHVEECFDFPEKRARAVLKALKQKERGLLTTVKRHYQVVKDIGRRSLEGPSHPGPPSRGDEKSAPHDRPHLAPQAGAPSGQANRQASGVSPDGPARDTGSLPRTGPSQPLPGTNKPGRNQPCPCGSGKKYKRCCGR